jgi:hypothetical protein
MDEVIRDKYRGRGVGFVQTGAAAARAWRRSSIRCQQLPSSPLLLAPMPP